MTSKPTAPQQPRGALLVWFVRYVRYVGYVWDEEPSDAGHLLSLKRKRWQESGSGSPTYLSYPTYPTYLYFVFYLGFAFFTYLSSQFSISAITCMFDSRAA